jgi:hypothetical protein
MAIFALEVAAFQNPEFAQITLHQLWIWHRSVGPFARHLFRHAQNQSNSLRTSAPSFPTTRTTAPVLRSEEKLTRLRSVSLFFIQMINMFCPFLWHSCGSLEFSMAFVHGLEKTARKLPVILPVFPPIISTSETFWDEVTHLRTSGYL